MDPSQSQSNQITETTSQPPTNDTTTKQSQPCQPPNPSTPPNTIIQKRNEDIDITISTTETPNPSTPSNNEIQNKPITPQTIPSKPETNEDIDITISSKPLTPPIINKIPINQNTNNSQISTPNLSNNLDSSSNNPLPLPIPIIPAKAKQFTFGCQIMIINLNTRKELNKKLGFVIGDYKPYSKRIPIRLISNDLNSSNAPIYLLKLNNLQFVSNPIPGYDVVPYNDDDNNDISTSDSSSDSSDSSSSSSDESSLSDTLANISNINMNINNNNNGNIADDEDDDIKKDNCVNENKNKEIEFKINDEKLEKINENMTKYYDIIEQFNKPETIDLSPSVTSTKSLPIDCGLRWEPKPITESIISMQISKIGIIKTIINDIEIVIESIHSPTTVITFDSVLCLSDHTPIGRVDDIFGAVKKPYYFVRLTVDSATQLKDKIQINSEIFAVKQLSNFITPPQCDERYSSQSDISDSDNDEQKYRPKYCINNNNKRNKRSMSVDRQSHHPNIKRNNKNIKRKYYNNNNNYNNKRQRYSNPGPFNQFQNQFQNQFAMQAHAQMQAQVQAQAQAQAQVQAQAAYQSYYYPSFNPLSTAIPPPQSNTVSAATTATYFRPQVNIIPSPPTNYINNVNRYGLAHSPQQHQSPNVSVSPIQQQQQQQVSPSQSQQTQQNASFPNATISINPFSFTKKK